MNPERINVALAGYANVGKSVIFNHLTGLHQHIGNWPGKTIEKAEGTLHYQDHTIDVIDLPGVYSLSTYSLEELITREYIASSKLDFIANVVDATNLETNLILTLQLLELEKPLVLALNMIDLLKQRGKTIDITKLEKLLGIPVVPTTATRGNGLSEILDVGLNLLAAQPQKLQPLKYGLEVEERIEKLCNLLNNIKTIYPSRFVAIKLLEQDHEIEKLISLAHPEILETTKQLSLELEDIHGHSSSIVIADERCLLASRVVTQVKTIHKSKQITFKEKLDYMTGHPVLGYPIMFALLGLMFLTVFKGGAYLSSGLETVSLSLKTVFYTTFGTSLIASLIWSGIASFLALVEIALPYVLPFYLLLFFLEGSGYLARVAYLMDHFMHKMGIHGKACIPLMLGFGCNVPACLGCRIMETQRERFITGLLSVFIPCSAVTIIVAGLVGKFVGTTWAFGLYLLVFLIIFVIGKIAAIVTPGKPTELIMAMPSYKLPNLKTIFKQTWFKLKEFLFIAGPIVIISGVIIEGANILGLLTYSNKLLSPITSTWLGLPPAVGILLIFGILRKELILVMLATVLGTTNFGLVLTKPQLITLALVSMLYIPCAATIAALKQEFGWKKAIFVTGLKTTVAIVVSGLIFRLLQFFNLS